MVQINPDYRPQVLFLGNGLNRLYGGNSWSDLMKKISVRNDLPDNLCCPFPLQTVLVTNDHVKRAMKNYEEDFFGTATEELTKQLQALLEIDFDDILTTNYSYEIESAAVYQTTVSKYFLKKSCKNIINGEKAEPKYLLHTYQSIPFNNHEHRIWHIHGEARKPNSMILGHYYYATLLYKMVEFTQTRGNNYQIHQKKHTPQTIRSWVDSFILGDVYILGFGMDFSEFDLWWLLNRKKREKASTGKVYFYSPRESVFNEKEELLKQLGVEVNHCDVTTPQGSETEKNLQYHKFYQNAMKDIKEKVNQIRVKQEKTNHG